jgi:multimeric flavodoxin WrbA
MKTLIFNGSPRPNGNTAALVKELSRLLNGEVKVVNAYTCGVKPCIDCRFCWKNEGCSIQDEMQNIYEDIQECDNVVIASPMQFLELSGQLLAVMSRLQTYWCGKFYRNTVPVPKSKHGGIIIVRGGEGRLTKAEHTAKTLLIDMNTSADFTVFADRSDEIPSIEQEQVLADIARLAKILNSQ